MPEPTDPWTEVRLTVPVAGQEPVTDWLMDRGAAGVREEYDGLWDPDGPVVSGDPSQWAGDAPPNATGRVTLVAWFDPLPDGLAADLRAFLRELEAFVPAASDAEIDLASVEPRDWNTEWKSSWQPSPAGRRLMICPSWMEPPPDLGDRLVVTIDPGMAFGTGTHFTTLSCLETLEDLLAARPVGEATSVLDVGTGSGILAIAALRLGAAHAVGTDIDPDAVEEAAGNADANGVGERFRGWTRPLDPGLGTFDLVLANVLAETVIELADALVGATAPGGDLILSGVLVDRQPSIDAAFGGRGLAKGGERSDRTWVTSWWRKG